MACPQSHFEVTQQVWTKGSASESFVPLVRRPTNELPRVKLSYLVLGTAQLTCTRAWRYSNDGVTWLLAAESIDDVFQAEGSWSWGTGYAMTRTDYRFVEYGIISKNTSGSLMETGTVRALFSVQDDHLSDFGSPPTAWGGSEHGITQSADGNRFVYTAATSPYGDEWDSPSAPWSLATVASTVGNPSGPSAAQSSLVYWIGYDHATGLWGVYKDTSWWGGSITLEASRAGSAHAVARVSVDGSGVATFDVSFDGVSWHTVHTVSGGGWLYRSYIVRDGATYTVFREARS